MTEWQEPQSVEWEGGQQVQQSLGDRDTVKKFKHVELYSAKLIA